MPIRIAVFNDYPQNLRLVKEVLTAKGFEVATYLQNFVDVSVVEQLQPNLIILAYVLGYDRNQLDIVNRLKEHPGTAGIPIVICTTGTVHNDGNAVLENIPIVPKPFDISDLLGAVNRILYRPDLDGHDKMEGSKPDHA